MEMDRLFEARPFDWSRVGLWGLMLMALGVAMVLAGPRLWPEREWPLKLGGVLLAVVGALGAMKIIG